MKASGVRRTVCLCLVLLVSAVLADTEAPDEKEKPKWARPRTYERKDDRERMVRVHIKGEAIKDKPVLDAMRNVPRHWFVPEDNQRSAYHNRPLRIGYGQTISQPYIVALMTQLLQLKSDHRVLEIGTGSGYQAAMLNELTPNVFTIEIINELGRAADAPGADPAKAYRHACRRVDRLKTRGYTDITARTGDGYHGWKEKGPFDAIIVTAASTHIPPPLIAQLKPGGRMVIPVGAAFRIQQLMLVRKDENGKITSRVITAVRFVPLTGGHEKRE